MKKATRYREYRPRIVDGKRVASGEYRSWQMMKNRCLNPKGEDFAHYQARGITVCDRWLLFDNFMDDMGARPFPEATLERVENDKGYGPGNCVWADRKAQSRNRSNARLLRGFRVWELVEQCQVKATTIHKRLWEVGQGIIPMGRVFAVGRCNKRRYL